MLLLDVSRRKRNRVRRTRLNEGTFFARPFDQDISRINWMLFTEAQSSRAVVEKMPTVVRSRLEEPAAVAAACRAFNFVFSSDYLKNETTSMPVLGEGVSKQICSEKRSRDTLFVTRNIAGTRFHPSGHPYFCHYHRCVFYQILFGILRYFICRSHAEINPI